MKFRNLCLILVLLVVGAALADARRDLQGKSNAPGQAKKKPNKPPKGKNSNPNAKFNRPGSSWDCSSASAAPHPKCIHANGNAAFKRGNFRDPNADSGDWEDVIDPPSTPPSPPSPITPGNMNSAQRRRAEALTNVFEFASVNPQYAYAENINDGRGITFGRCGFCTGTGDGLIVVAEYTKRKPTNPLAKYLPELYRIDAAKVGESNGDVSGLLGFEAVVKSLGGDSEFRAVQDWAQENMYYAPSQRTSDSLGLQYALSRAQLYDAYIMHGENEPGDAFYPKSANGIAAWTSAKLGGYPGTGLNETVWLATYMERRKAILGSSGAVWGEASNRIDIYQWLANAKVYNLDRAIKLYSGSCGSSGVCDVSASSVSVGPSIYGDFTIS